MEFESLLLLVVIWLLWIIHQDLTESNDRQRSLRATLNQLASRVEHIIAARPYNAIEELREVHNAIFSEIQDRVSL